MEILMSVGIIILSYLIGSIPFGYIIVKLKTGEDIRTIQSGRTGGTNTMRAAGFWYGLVAGILDVLKGAAAVWLARAEVPGGLWVTILAPIAAILGHNYSIYLLHKNENGKLQFSGGAGGAPTLGGSFGLWSPSILIIFPLGAIVFYFVGYASVTTMSIGFLSIIIFSILSILKVTPWHYILFGVVAQIILLYELRDNIKRLVQGNERLHGFRARHKKAEGSPSFPK
jgi:glycerol-3-phosphate acyltransferase PlsY